MVSRAGEDTSTRKRRYTLMNKLTLKLASVNWRLVMALASVVAFAVAGAADDGGGW